MSDEWLIAGSSVMGGTHLKKGLPNQDAYLTYVADEGGYPIVLAVADGHGSSNYFRSDRGARFAVSAAKEVLLKFHRDTDPKDLHAMDIRELICRNIVRRWNEMVMNDVATAPYTEAEIGIIGPQEKDVVNRIMNTNRPNREVRPYGSTVLASLICSDYIIMVQLGDGDISIIGKDGRPNLCFSIDEAIGDETCSLCLPNPEYDFKYTIWTRPSVEEVRMVFLSTDGYSKAFSTKEGFMKVVTDIHDYIVQPDHLSRVPLLGRFAAIPLFGSRASTRRQFNRVERELEGWLERTTKEVSGDDITVAMAVRVD